MVGILEGLGQTLQNPNPLLTFGLGVLGSNQGNYGRLGPALYGGMQALQTQQQFMSKKKQDELEAELRRQELEMKKQDLALQQAERQRIAEATQGLRGTLGGLQASPQRDIALGLLNINPNLAANAITGLAGGPQQPPITASQSDYLYGQQNPAFREYQARLTPPVSQRFADPITGQMMTTVTPRAAFNAGQTTGAITKPAAPLKPLPAGEEESITSAIRLSKNLDTIRQNVSSGAVNTGLIAQWITGGRYKVGGLPADHPINQTVSAINQSAADIQSAIKGAPSNYDAKKFEATLPSLDKDENANIAAIELWQNNLRTAVAAKIANYTGKGIEIPATLQAEAAKLGLTADDIPDPSRKAYFAYSPADAAAKELLKKSMIGGQPVDEASLQTTMEENGIESYAELLKKLRELGMVE